jgi:hypothetical protein
MTAQRSYHLRDAVGRAINDVVNGLKNQSRDLRSEFGNQTLQINLAGERFYKLSKFRGLSDEMIEKARDYAIDQVDRGNSVCESPIERLILPWLIMQDYGIHLQPLPVLVHIPKEDATMPRGGVVVVPQFAFARFRVDFALVGRHGPHTKIVAIECDGEDFHDPMRDKARDAYLKSWGIDTIRANGASISRDPSDLARQGAMAIIAWADSVGVSYG